MKSAIVLWMLLVVSAPALDNAGSKYVVAEIAESDGGEHFEVMTTDEFRKLQSDIRSRAAMHRRALALAMKEWAADEQTGADPFPRSAIRERKARTVGRIFSDREEAEEKQAECQAKLAERQRREDERRKDKNSRLIQMQRRGPQVSYRMRADRARRFIRNTEQKEQLQDAVAAQALAMYEKHMAALSQAVSSGNEQEAPVAE